MPKPNPPPVDQSAGLPFDAVTTSKLSTKPAKAPTIEERNAQVSKKLAERYDALNQAIAAAEHKLKELKPPFPVWVEYNHVKQPAGYEEFEVIGMAKVENQWRLVHGEDNDGHPYGEPAAIQPLTDCSLEVRLQAVIHLEELQERIVERKEQFIPRVEKAIKRVLDFCQGGKS